jgi:protein SCO1/2
MKASTLTLLAVGSVALGLGFWAARQSGQPASAEAPVTEAVTAFAVPRPLPMLQLVDKDGAAVGREAFTGHWSLVFMGFTNCGHICPTKMAELRMIHDSAAKSFTPVFFSVDPGRDSPSVIKAYVEGFDPVFDGFTGSAEAVATFAGALGAPYFVDTNPDNYIVDHSTALFLIDPDGALAGTVSPPFDIPAIVRDLDLLIR